MQLQDRTNQQQSYDHQRGDGSAELEPLDLGNNLHIPYEKVHRMQQTSDHVSIYLDIYNG
jgi:hypothetical protein